MESRTLGRTNLSVSPVCVGTSALGGFAELFGYDVSEDTAVATIRRVFDGPFTFIDTANEYGHGGDSERRIGRAIAEHGGLPEGVLVATKVDPKPGSDDFSGDRVRASVEESLERLGLDVLPLVHLHDPQKITFEEAVGPGGAWEALLALRDEGVIGSLGVAGGSPDLQRRYLATGAVDVVLSHNRYTLVDSSAETLIDDVVATGAAFVNAAPFGGGMLVKGPDVVSSYAYTPASDDTLARVRGMQDACREYDVPLAAAALQFSLRDRRIASTVVGMSEPSRIDATVALADHPIPDELWDRILPLAALGRSGV
ncbi:aldo/keto reductase [Planctomonas psychrotolerans]|uniref:aldo/keto reductase n=1 Tax=Planctomonas psychrotolerans TaxID=2528712 RepID=UPI00123A1998|nr:aldo/keto reductase [Planctomonas psychrotolerans]